MAVYGNICPRVARPGYMWICNWVVDSTLGLGDLRRSAHALRGHVCPRIPLP